MGRGFYNVRGRRGKVNKDREGEVHNQCVLKVNTKGYFSQKLVKI